MHTRSLPAIAAAGLAAGLAFAPARLPRADAQPTKPRAAGVVRLTLAAGLPTDLVYWLTNGQRSTEPHPLPAPDGPARAVSIPVPAGFADPDATLCVLDVKRARVARIPMAGLLEDSDGPAAHANLFRNPDFARGTETWVFERAQEFSASPVKILPSSAGPTGVRWGVASIAVQTATEQPWHVQFYQNSMDLDEGRAYELQFWARSDRERPLSVNVNTTAGDAHGIGLTANRIPLTPRWRRLSYTFTATRTVPNHSRITFLLGEDTGTVQLAGLRLAPAAAARTDGQNLFRNGDFRRDRSNWSLDLSNSAAATWAISDQNLPESAVGRVARITVTTLGKERWHVLFAQSGIDLKAGEVYVLSFWARADHDRPLALDSNVDMPDWRPIGLYGGVSLTAEWKRWTIAFTAQNVLANHSRLVFLLGDDTGRVDLADVRLERRAAGSASNLTPDQFRFSQSIEIPVRYRGSPVTGVEARATATGFTAQVTLQPADRGIARFSDAPVGTPITLTVHHGTRTARFERTIPAEGVGELPEIALPDDWTDVDTVDGAAPTQQNPLHGAWETRRGADGKRYRFTFNADGTGSVRPAATAVGAAPPQGPVPNPFRWYVKNGGSVLVIGTRAYRWTIEGEGDARKLTLRDAKNVARVLYRAR